MKHSKYIRGEWQCCTVPYRTIHYYVMACPLLDLNTFTSLTEDIAADQTTFLLFLHFSFMPAERHEEETKETEGGRDRDNRCVRSFYHLFNSNKRARGQER